MGLLNLYLTASLNQNNALPFFNSPNDPTSYPSTATGTPTSTTNPGAPPQRFTVQYGPSSTYLSSLASSQDQLDNTLNITNLDNTDSGVDGGIPYKPLKDPTIYPATNTGTPTPTANPGASPQKFDVVYTPASTYLNFISSPSSSQDQLANTLRITNLDTTDPGVNGGVPYKPLTDPTIYPITTTKTVEIRGFFPTSSQPPQKFNQVFNTNNNYLDFIKSYIQ